MLSEGLAAGRAGHITPGIETLTITDAQAFEAELKQAQAQAMPEEQAKMASLREIADRALARAGRKSLPEDQVKVADYDLSKAPMVIQRVAGSMEALSDEDAKAESLAQWPHLIIEETEEGMKALRLRLIGYAVGLALAVTKLEAEPVTMALKAAVAIGIDLSQRQAAARRAERLGIQAAARRDLELQKKRKAQKAARKRNR